MEVVELRAGRVLASGKSALAVARKFRRLEAAELECNEAGLAVESAVSDADFEIASERYAKVSAAEVEARRELKNERA